MLAAAALGALGAQLAEIRAAKEDWFVGARISASCAPRAPRAAAASIAATFLS